MRSFLPRADLEAAVETLRLLAQGCDPVTGEVLPDGPCRNPEAIQAFVLAADLLEKSCWESTPPGVRQSEAYDASRMESIRPEKRPPVRNVKGPNADETRDILQAVDDHPTPMGYTKWAAVLAGTRQQNLMKAGHLDVAHYGLFAGLRQARIKRYLESLVAEGMLHRTLEAYPVLVLTDKGRAFLRERASAGASAANG